MCIEVKCKSATFFYQNTDTKAKSVEVRAAKSTICSQLELAQRQTAALKTQLPDAKLALEKLAAAKSQMEADI